MLAKLWKFILCEIEIRISFLILEELLGEGSYQVWDGPCNGMQVSFDPPSSSLQFKVKSEATYFRRRRVYKGDTVCQYSWECDVFYDINKT